jgi:hypothetical protein
MRQLTSVVFPVNYLHNLVIGSSGDFSLYSGLQSLETCRQGIGELCVFKEPEHWCR